MSRYIDADKLISRQAAIDALVTAIRKDPYYDSNEAINGLGVCDVRVILNDLPSAQPERKKGKWIITKTERGWNCAEYPTEVTCSNCNYIEDYQKALDFCPNCGAYMRGDQT